MGEMKTFRVVWTELVECEGWVEANNKIEAESKVLNGEVAAPYNELLHVEDIKECEEDEPRKE